MKSSKNFNFIPEVSQDIICPPEKKVALLLKATTKNRMSNSPIIIYMNSVSHVVVLWLLTICLLSDPWNNKQSARELRRRNRVFFVAWPRKTLWFVFHFGGLKKNRNKSVAMKNELWVSETLFLLAWTFIYVYPTFLVIIGTNYLLCCFALCRKIKIPFLVNCFLEISLVFAQKSFA